MAKKIEKTQVKLSEIPFGAKIEIGGFEYVFKGFEKRKTIFGKQEHFVFWSEESKQEKIFERFKFSTIKIKKISDNEFKW